MLLATGWRVASGAAGAFRTWRQSQAQPPTPSS